MRNLDYDLLRSTSPPNSRVATPTLIPTHISVMSNKLSGNPSNPSSPTLPPANSQLSPDTVSSSSTPRDPAASISSANHAARHPSRASSVSSVASNTGSKPKISPAPTTVKQKHYWNYYHQPDEMEPSTSNGTSTAHSLMQSDDIVNAASDNFNFGAPNQETEPAAPPPPAPPPVRYTRTGQVIPEGKVMMVNGGCVGEGDWKRTNGAIQSMFEPLHHVLTHEGKVPQVLPSNGFWLRAMTDQAVLELCKAYDIEPDPDGDARKNRAAFLNYLGATYLAAVV